MKPSQLLNSPSKWTRGAWARNSHGEVVHSQANSAVRWCLVGALERCGVNSKLNRIKLMTHLQIVDYGLSSWNDSNHRRWKHVHAALRKVGL